jgi:Mg2+ and Co2+ transporter CorA
LDQLGRRPGHQRVLEGSGELLLVVHEVPKAGVREREALFFWKTRRDGWRSREVPGGLRGLQELLERYATVIDELEEDLESAEKGQQLYQILKHTLPLCRSLRNLVGVLEGVLALEDGEREVLALRDRARELERSAELLHADAQNALTYFHTESAEEQAEAAHRTDRAAMKLNLLAAMFLPLIGLSGLFGMNVVNGLEDSRGALWIIAAVGLGGGYALLRVFIGKNHQ